MTEELWLGLGKWRKGVSRSRQHPLKCAFWLRLVCRPAGSGQVRQAKEVAAGTRAWHRRAEKWWGWLKARRWVKRCQVAVFSALHILHWDHFFLLLRNTTRKKLVGKAIKDENVKLKQEDSPPASFKMFLYSPLRFASVGTSFLDKNNQVWGRCFFCQNGQQTMQKHQGSSHSNVETICHSGTDVFPCAFSFNYKLICKWHCLVW